MRAPLRLAATLVAMLVAIPAISSCSLSSSSSESQVEEQANSSEVLTVAFEDSAPGTFVQTDGALAGWEYELVELLATEMGMTTEYVPTRFGEIISQVQSGAVDMGIASMFDTTERERFVDFVNYFQGGTQWVRLATGQDQPFDPCGLRIAALSDSAQLAEFLPSRSDLCVSLGKPAITKFQVPTVPDAVELVRRGEIDGFVADGPAVVYAAQASSGQLEVIGSVEEIEAYGIPVNKDNVKLAEALTKSLTTLINDGTYSRLLGKWGLESGALTEATINRGFN